ncbi:MAG: zinc ribbon domain-containing protein [Candidatus Heimdallarchaeota archaeon]|nr:zinc ribbon domain-containing protein [Candidatus Heimdallarchaeota archaeon]
MVKFCPKCGARAIPGARFCRSCGARLEKEDQEEKMESEPIVNVEESKKIEIKSKPKSAPIKVELTEQEEESLLILSKIIPIQKKIEELKKDKDGLEIKFRVEEEIAEKDYNIELKKINTEISKMEKEIEEKRKVMATVSLLNLVEEVMEMRERQEKLEEIFKEGRIQESTYDRLKREYKEKEEETEANVDTEETKLKQYRDNLVYEKEQVAIQKEEFFARHQVGEFTEAEYRAKVKELDARNIDDLIAAVDEIISRMSRV